MRKYIYGPGVDEPLCMIDVEDSNSVYYYHFDGLGSVVALSDAAGDTVQTYEYSIFGQVAASDPNHPNPYLFTGRRFDTETGLYYYRARYYNPYIGRFMQTDPAGYSEGINMYTYCRNNPVARVDPSGNASTTLQQMAIRGGAWANCLPRPSYPGNWTSWLDFFGWYAHGEGGAVDLRKIGLLDDFRANEQISAWEEELRELGDELGRTYARLIASTGRDGGTITYDGYKRSYEFAGGKWDILESVILGSSGFTAGFGDPLVVLGGGTVEATITITAWREPAFPNRVYWERIISYSMDDSFSDPGDFFDTHPGTVEWMDCTPYAITAKWWSVNGGWIGI